MSKSLRILVAGDVEGKLDELYKRVRNIMKKNGEFDMLICVGNFFGDSNDEWEEYLKGTRSIPVFTYVLGPCKKEHEQYYMGENGKELCPNLVFLGKSGVMTGTSGLKMLYLSGVENGTGMCKITENEIEKLIPQPQETKAVDILLTSQWPAGITKYSSIPSVNIQKFESPLISKVAYFLKPRYHFAALANHYYERQPYRNHKICVDASYHTTRFIALAKVGNTNKSKWLYAFTIVPICTINKSELVKQPLDVTECPFSITEADHPSLKPRHQPSQQFFYDSNTDYSQDNPRKRKRDDRERKPLSNCWFCLKSPDIEKHLILSIGDQNYLSLCKGGLTDDHILILPIDHLQSTPDCSEECRDEIEQYKKALIKFYRTQNKTPVFFERNYRSPHLQIQVVPIPSRLEEHLRTIVIEQAEHRGLRMDEIPEQTDLYEVLEPRTPFFYIEWGSHRMLHLVKAQFPLQFGREILASKPILNVPDKEDYKTCMVGQEHEEKLAARFKNGFKNFDFTE